MDLLALRSNLQRGCTICPKWSDRIKYLLWLYSNIFPVKHLSRSQRRIAFRYPAPIGNINVALRNNQGSDAFIFSEVFDHRYYDFDLPFEPATILDLGANAGFVSLFLGRKYSRATLACVEPIAMNVALLRRNLQLNGIVAVIFAAAVCITDGVIQMTMATLDYGHKVAGIGYGKTIAGRIIEVESLTVPSIMKRLNWPRVGLLKVDIEGYEGILLKQNCDWLQNVDSLCVECHEGYGESDLISLAREFGFKSPSKLPGIWLLTRN